MIDEREIVRRAAEALTPPDPAFERLLRRRDHVQRNQRVRAGVLGLAVAIAVGWLGVNAIRSTPSVPADDRSEELGIFEPAAGRIVYVNEGIDLGYDHGLWAVDPSGPSDTTEGPSVADDVASTLVRLGPEEAIPLGWSSDGTELLFKRTSEDLFPQEYLYILHADGSETRLNRDPLYFGGATIAPDGTRVVFAAWADELGLYVVDTEGGRPVRLPYPSAGDIVSAPTFSPDGTQIAYLVSGDREDHVWVADADGSDAHEILADEPTLFVGVSGLEWSPAGDRLAIGLGDDRRSDGLAIYTFAPDGSDFTQVITGGISPYWSPDGSQIAYTIPCDEHPNASCPVGSLRRSQFDVQQGGRSAGLAIADADGSNVRGFGFAASGPWHPVPADQPTTPSPAPSDSVLRRAGEVLLFTGTEAPGDLVAVTPGTGEERVLVEDLADVSNARWSADGRWVAFETPGSLWVVDGTREPRQVFEMPESWIWSSTGAELAVIRGSTLSVVDPSTGLVTELASTVGDVTSAPAWSPDGTRIVFGARGGSVYSVDVRTGERSRIVQLPGEDLDSIDGIEWSPDGSRLAVLNDLEPGGGRLFVLNPDGSDIRVLADGTRIVFGFDWSPDGSRIAFTEDHGTELRVFVAPADGSTRSLVASLSINGPASVPVWSPDGSQIALGNQNALLTEDAENLLIDADGSGDAVPLDDLTYESWRGGSYDCDCDTFG